MRITDNQVASHTLESFSTARGRMDAAQLRVTTGHRFDKASEDPVAAGSLIKLASQSRAVTQYQRNIGAATSRLNLEQGSLDQLTDLLTRAKELGVAGGTDTVNDAGRKAMAAEVGQLLAQAVQIANTKSGGEYIYGGDRSTTVPYSIDTSGPVVQFSVAAPAPSGTRSVEIGASQTVTAGSDGTRIFGTSSSGMLAALQSLAAALESGGRGQVAAALPGIDQALSGAQAMTAETGARINALDVASNNLQALATQYAASASDLQDVNMEEALSDLVNRQTAYQAALAATSRILNTSLTDYLR
ncbi:MAG: flagellar hook-associated protein FlgL [Gemmatimonadaceae bacterium]|nr:flagellar hook-associated protein FlgL [Gemmatimonadaceae bacterium]